MRLILFLIGGLVLANIVSATFIWPPADEASGPRRPIVNAATERGQEPWLVSEKYAAPSREHIRKGVLRTLDKPWATYCTPNGHKELVDTVNNYFYQRDAEAWSKVNTYGEQARSFAIKAWATPDDNRIERLIGETYGRGYFALSDLQPHARTPLRALAKDAQVNARPCAS